MFRFNAKGISGGQTLEQKVVDFPVDPRDLPNCGAIYKDDEPQSGAVGDAAGAAGADGAAVGFSEAGTTASSAVGGGGNAFCLLGFGFSKCTTSLLPPCCCACCCCCCCCMKWVNIIC